MLPLGIHLSKLQRKSRRPYRIVWTTVHARRKHSTAICGRRSAHNNTQSLNSLVPHLAQDVRQLASNFSRHVLYPRAYRLATSMTHLQRQSFLALLLPTLVYKGAGADGLRIRSKVIGCNLKGIPSVPSKLQPQNISSEHEVVMINQHYKAWLRSAVKRLHRFQDSL